MDNQGNSYISVNKGTPLAPIFFRAWGSTSNRSFAAYYDAVPYDSLEIDSFVVDANYNVYTNIKRKDQGGIYFSRFIRQGVFKDIPVGKENDMTVRAPLSIREKSNFALRPSFRLTQDSSRLYIGGFTRSIAIELDDPVDIYLDGHDQFLESPFKPGDLNFFRSYPFFSDGKHPRIILPEPFFMENSVFQGDLRVVSHRSVYKINTIGFNMNPPTALTNITVSEVITGPIFSGEVPVISFKITWSGGDGASFYLFAGGNSNEQPWNGIVDPVGRLSRYLTPLSDDTVSSRTATFSGIYIKRYVAIYAINSGGVASRLFSW